MLELLNWIFKFNKIGYLGLVIIIYISFFFHITHTYMHGMGTHKHILFPSSLAPSADARRGVQHTGVSVSVNS